MSFVHQSVNREARYWLGVETESAKPFLSIPVSVGVADYEEYYELTPDEANRFKRDPAAALPFVERCRQRLEDARLMEKPGWNRGVPV